jgi:hypothetical protein
MFEDNIDFMKYPTHSFDRLRMGNRTRTSLDKVPFKGFRGKNLTMNEKDVFF